MESMARKSDGRRVFTPEFKRQQIERVLRGELTLAELSRELQISRPLRARWKSLITAGAEVAVEAIEEGVRVAELRVAERQIRELHRRAGKNTVGHGNV